MSQSKDPTIKLFGRTIPLPDCLIPSLSAASSQTPNNSDIMDACSIITKVDGDDTIAENSGKPNKSSALWNSEEQEQSLTLMNKTQLNPKSKEDQIETNSGDQEEVFKKPDKILPCPRCNSYDTKFCYFNNYNVNQPRHYCRKCHRYWTAGGTMRNVPIGAGRRKHKHLASQYGQVMVSSNAAPISQVQNSDSASHELLACGKLPNPLRRNRVVLEVGSDGNFSTENVLNLKDQKIHADKSSVNCGENGEEPSLCGSSVTVSSFLEHNMPEKIMPREQGGLGSQGSCNNLPPPQHLNCYPIPWAFTSNVGWNNATHIAPMMAIPGFCTSSTPVQFVPASFLDYKPIWPGIIGNISMAAGVNSCPSPSSSTSNSCPGKRPRIDDPDEGSKLHTCGPVGMIMKPDKTDHPESKCDIFVAFEPNP